MNLSRRSLITGLVSFVAAPAIVRATSIMPVKAWAPALPTMAVGKWEGFTFIDEAPSPEILISDFELFARDHLQFARASFTAAPGWRVRHDVKAGVILHEPDPRGTGPNYLAFDARVQRSTQDGRDGRI